MLNRWNVLKYLWQWRDKSPGFLLNVAYSSVLKLKIHKKSAFYPKNHIGNVTQNSHFENLIFDKIHISQLSQISIFIKFLFSTCHFSQNWYLENLITTYLIKFTFLISHKINFYQKLKIPGNFRIKSFRPWWVCPW